ncbi:hypothetical protein CEUSTIGMA_g8052.t1 [Chlamydomonas eustigma]|uniref:RAP domain-containing protein n=1 Tax=Chlamydomonas eustigma TaxID=1157962 RepID=A0A250XC00_9CHLO|nr:hypothetical protein CEUSTIGMA_g8052.t1 [Chlamydomonas eustigma]|eukprot:GAX80617.1 hypothetical protein CEUSTIGMA_g8052.t1 [Chlamydomonas eustigma]
MAFHLGRITPELKPPCHAWQVKHYFLKLSHVNNASLCTSSLRTADVGDTAVSKRSRAAATLHLITGRRLRGLENAIKPPEVRPLLRKISSMSTDELCSMLAALVDLQLPLDTLSEASILNAISSDLPSMSKGQQVGCLLSLSQLSMRPTSTWMSETMRILLGGNGLGCLTMRELLELTGALSTLNCLSAVSSEHKDFYAQLMRALQPVLHRMALSDHAWLLSCMATLTISPDPEWMSIFKHTAALKLREGRLALYEEYRGGSCTQSLHQPACSTLTLDSSGSSTAIARSLEREDSLKLVESSGKPSGTSVTHEMSRHWGLSVALPVLLHSLCTCCSFDQYNGHDVMWVELWACSATVLRAVGRTSSVTQQVCSPEYLVRIADAAGGLRQKRGITPPVGWLRLLAAASERLATRLPPSHVATLCYALGRLRVRHCSPFTIGSSVTASVAADSGSIDLATRWTQKGIKGVLEKDSDLSSVSLQTSSTLNPHISLTILASQLSQMLPRLEASDLVLVCRALPYLKLPRTAQFSAALAEAASTKAEQLGANGMSVMALALADHAVLQTTDFEFDLETAVEAVMSASFSCMAQMEGRDMSTLLASVVRLGGRPSPEWMSRFLTHFLHKLHHLSPSHMSRTAWAVATLGHRPNMMWWAPFLKEVLGRMSCFEARDLAKLVWAVAKVGPPQRLHDNWIFRFYDKVACQLRHADAHSISLILWSVAVLDWHPPAHWLHSICEAASLRFQSANGQSLANIAWAVAKIGYHPGGMWCSRLLDSLHEPGRRLTSQDIANTTWAMAQLSYRHPPQAWTDRHAEVLMRAVSWEMRHKSDAGLTGRQDDAMQKPGHQGYAMQQYGHRYESGHVLTKAGAAIYKHNTQMARSAVCNKGEAGCMGMDGLLISTVLADGRNLSATASHIIATLLALNQMDAWPSRFQEQQLLGVLLEALPHAAPDSLSGTAACLLASQAWAWRRTQVPWIGDPARPKYPFDSIVAVMERVDTLPSVDQDLRIKAAVGGLSGLDVATDVREQLVPADPSNCSLTNPQHHSALVSKQRLFSQSTTLTAPSATALGVSAASSLGPSASGAEGGEKTLNHGTLKHLVPRNSGPVSLSYESATLPPRLVNRDLLGSLLLSTARQMHLMRPSHLIQLAWALARMGFTPDSKWLSRFEDSLQRESSQLTLPARAILLWSLTKSGWGAKMKHLVLEVLVPIPALAVELVVTDQHHHPRAQRDVSMCLWSLAMLRVRPGRAWWPQLLQTTDTMLRSGSLSTQSLVMIIFSVGKLRIRPPLGWCEAALCCCENQIKSGMMGARALACILTGLTWSLRDPPGACTSTQVITARLTQLLMQVAATVEAAWVDTSMTNVAPGGSQVNLGSLFGDEEISSHSLPMLLWAAVRLGLPLDRRAVRAAVIAAKQMLPKCSQVQHMVICCWALAKLGACPGQQWLADVQTLVETSFEYVLALVTKVYCIPLTLVTKAYCIPLTLVTVVYCIPLALVTIAYCTPLTLVTVAYCIPLTLVTVVYCIPLTLVTVVYCIPLTLVTKAYCTPLTLVTVAYCIPLTLVTKAYCIPLTLVTVVYCIPLTLVTVVYCIPLTLVTVVYCISLTLVTVVYCIPLTLVTEVYCIPLHPRWMELSGAATLKRTFLAVIEEMQGRAETAHVEGGGLLVGTAWPPVLQQK